MMYKDQMVLCIKSNGKVLRENQGKVNLQFGSEYSIYMKNLSGKDAVVNLSIDGSVITDEGLVIRAHSDVNLERYLDRANKFKFLERTAKIEQFSGIGSEDGLITLNFQFEADPVITAENVQQLRRLSGCGMLDCRKALVQFKGKMSKALRHLQSNSFSAKLYSKSSSSSRQSEYSCDFMSQDLELSRGIGDVGITGDGSKSNQEFVTVDDFKLSSEVHSMTLQILGNRRNTHFVDSTKICDKCGTKNPHSNKCCGECGNMLEKF